MSLTRDSLYLADEAFMCDTAAELTPAREIDRRVGRGSRGPWTELLRSRHVDVVVVVPGSRRR